MSGSGGVLGGAGGLGGGGSFIGDFIVRGNAVVIGDAVRYCGVIIISVRGSREEIARSGCEAVGGAFIYLIPFNILNCYICIIPLEV